MNEIPVHSDVKFYVVYTDGGTPSIKCFETERLMNEWLLPFLLQQHVDFSIDAIFHGELQWVNPNMAVGFVGTKIATHVLGQ